MSLVAPDESLNLWPPQQPAAKQSGGSGRVVVSVTSQPENSINAQKP